MYYHLIENGKRNGVSGYIYIKRYKSYSALLKYLLRTGRPVWVVESGTEYLPYVPPIKTYGGFVANYWNTGGWGTTTMPRLPLLDRK